MKISKEFKIGLLVIVVLAATFTVINILRGKDILGREFELKGYFDDVQTLVASAPVQIRGYAAGRVNDVKYDREKDKFEVTCSVSKEFRIPSDSRMVLYSTSIMGGKGIRIDAGSAEELVSDGSVLATGADSDLLSSLGEGLTPILNKVSSALDSLKEVISGVNSVLSDANKRSIQSSLQHLNATLADARHLASTIDGKSPQLDSIINNLSGLSAKLSPIAASAQDAMENVKQVTGQLAGTDIKKTVTDIDEAVAGINSAVEKIKDPLGNVLSDADSLVRAIKDNPKKYIKITVF